VAIGFISSQLMYARAPWIMDLLDSLWILPGTASESFDIPGLGHMYLMLKDPGWGVGKWEVGDGFSIIREDGEITRGYMPPTDVRGREMDGTWILLDPTYSASNDQFIPLGFGDNFPAWIDDNPNSLKFAILP